MEKSKVYFTDFRTEFGVGYVKKLKKLIKTAGMNEIDMEKKFVAIKMHFGELGNLSFLRPNYARAVVDMVKEAGGIVAGKMAILAEGDAVYREDIIYLNHIPLFTPEA